MKPRFVAVAKIVSPSGREGRVEVKVLSEVEGRISPASKFFLAPPLPSLSQVTVEKVFSSHQDKLRVKFAEVSSFEEAQALKGRFLQIPVEACPDLPPDTYWEFQIVGLECFTDKGARLGKVQEVIKTGANDVYLVVEGDKEVLIPAIKSVVKQVDLENGKLIVALLPGLLEEQ
jgi:16S rRNA processing protein RimM